MKPADQNASFNPNFQSQVIAMLNKINERVESLENELRRKNQLFSLEGDTQDSNYHNEQRRVIESQVSENEKL